MSQGTKAADHGKKISMFEALKGEANSTEERNVTVSQVSCSRKKFKPAPKFSDENCTNWRNEIVHQRAEPN
jgi:hypothetical protein